MKRSKRGRELRMRTGWKSAREEGLGEGVGKH